jgi:predicted transcriptional regulator
MIGQNRQASFQQTKADEDYKDVNTLLVENTDLTRDIHKLAEDLHQRLTDNGTATS